MPTTSFPIATTGIIIAGSKTVDANWIGFPAWGVLSRIDLKATGTAFTFKMWSYHDDTITVFVDGVDVTPSYTEDGWITTASISLGAEGPHQVTIKSGTRQTYFNSSDFIQLTGAAPAVAYVTGFGPQQLASSGNTFISGDHTGAYNTVSFEGAWEGVWLRFKATCSSLKLVTYQGSGPTTLTYRLVIDGVIQSAQSAQTRSGLYWDYADIATGLDGGAEHEYLVMLDKRSDNGAQLTSMYAVMTDAAGSINTTPLTVWPAMAFYGDSINSGYFSGAAGPTGNATGFPVKLCITRRRGYINAGNPAMKVSTFLRDNTAQVTAHSAYVDKVVVLGGANDLGVTAPSTFASDYTTMLTNLRSGLAIGTKIYAVQILNNGVHTVGERNTANAAIAADVAAIADANVTTHNTDGWITPDSSPGGDTYPDLQHPGDVGSAKVYTQLLGVVPADVGVSIAETTIERGQSGQALTVALTGGTSSGVGDWTLAVGGSSGTITAQSGSNPYTLTVTAPQTTGTATLTHTPSGGHADITVQDTTAPSSPTGVSAGGVTAYTVPLAFTLPAASPSGETVTATLRKNASVVATGQTSSPYTFAGVVDGDVLKVRSVDNAGNESSDTTVTFAAPTGGGGLLIIAAGW